LDFFTGVAAAPLAALFLGVETFSPLELRPFGSLDRLTGAGLGDFSLGEMGGVTKEALAVLPLETVLFAGDDKGCSAGGEAFWEGFFAGFRLSKRDTRLQAGCSTGRPLM